MVSQKKIITVLLIVIAVLIIICMALFLPLTGEHSTLTIGDDTIYAGDSLVVVLSDDGGNAISNQTIHVKLTDGDGKTIDESIVTDSEGKAKLSIDDKGKYSVECRFDGNGEYSSSSMSGEITVEDAQTTVVGEEQTSTNVHSSKYASDGSIYPEYGPAVDSQGITREYAIANDMHYIEMTVDGDHPGEYVTVGGYVAYDPAAGCYHT